MITVVQCCMDKNYIHFSYILVVICYLHIVSSWNAQLLIAILEY